MLAEEAKLLRDVHALKNKSLIEAAEKIVSDRPPWFKRTVAKIDKDIKRRIESGKDTIFYFIPTFSLGVFSKVKRAALGIEYANKGYYVSAGEGSIYISWASDYTSGILRWGSSLEKRNGKWNNGEDNVKSIYKGLLT